MIQTSEDVKIEENTLVHGLKIYPRLRKMTIENQLPDEKSNGKKLWV